MIEGDDCFKFVCHNGGTGCQAIKLMRKREMDTCVAMIVARDTRKSYS